MSPSSGDEYHWLLKTFVVPLRKRLNPLTTIHFQSGVDHASQYLLQSKIFSTPTPSGPKFKGWEILYLQPKFEGWEILFFTFSVVTCYGRAQIAPTRLPPTRSAADVFACPILV